MLYRTLVFLFALSLFLLACQSTSEESSEAENLPGNMADLEFLLGKWHVTTDFPKYVYESWKKLNDNELSGIVYEINRLGDSTVREKLSIKLTDDGIVYMVDFLNEGARDTFLLTDVKNGLVFSDPENEFPTDIVYRPHDRGITVLLEGGGETMEMSYEDPARSDARKADGLGSFVQVAIGVEDLEAEKAFYEKFGFRVIVQSDEPYPFFQMTNESVILNLSQDGMTYQGLAYFDKAMGERVIALEKEGFEILMKETQDDGTFNFGVIDDPDGYGIGLINYDPWQMMEGDIRKPCDLGKFGEFTFPVSNLDASIAWYESIGFELDSRYEQPYPWAIMNDGKMMIGLHQTIEAYYKGPSMTFFSINSDEVITELLDKGLEPIAPDEWNIGDKTINAIFTSPGGNQVSIFFGAL